MGKGSCYVLADNGGTMRFISALACLLFYSGCAPEADIEPQTAPGASMVPPAPVPEVKVLRLPALPPGMDTAKLNGIAPLLVPYVQSASVCDHLYPGSLDLIKEELRSVLGPTLWDSHMEQTTDEFKNGRGAEIAQEMIEAISAGQVSRGRMLVLCFEDVTDHKQKLVDHIEALIQTVK